MIQTIIVIEDCNINRVKKVEVFYITTTKGMNSCIKFHICYFIIKIIFIFVGYCIVEDQFVVLIEIDVPGMRGKLIS